MAIRLILFLIGTFLLTALHPAAAGADAITFQNGRTLDCIIVKEENASVKVQFSWGGYMTIQRSEISGITQESPERNKQLMAVWKQQHQAEEQRKKDKAAFEADQRAKGLVKYNGEWLTREEIELARDKRADREIDQLNQQVSGLQQKIQLLEYENQQLRQEINTQRKLYVTPQTVIIQKIRPEKRRDGSSSRQETRSSGSSGNSSSGDAGAEKSPDVDADSSVKQMVPVD